MEKLEPNSHYRMMAWFFAVRDVFASRKTILEEVALEPGASVLDYGCGPGSYIPGVAQKVGEAGKVYALDIHPLACELVQKRASKLGLKNVEAICSDCETGLPDASLDVVLLYDVFHDLSNPEKVLEELHRVLKPEGILSFSDHHLKGDEGIASLTKAGLFAFVEKGKRTLTFRKQQS